MNRTDTRIWGSLMNLRSRVLTLHPGSVLLLAGLDNIRLAKILHLRISKAIKGRSKVKATPVASLLNAGVHPGLKNDLRGQGWSFGIGPDPITTCAKPPVAN
ncbi:hypothetical protein VNO77_02379 [Canavalia gladiata]|uniref:Uncharacterized protein n=1 Tax=Canavalia gladiata TaxID=3824 RepID=A0AAN9MT52_CANGL